MEVQREINGFDSIPNPFPTYQGLPREEIRNLPYGLTLYRVNSFCANFFRNSPADGAVFTPFLIKRATRLELKAGVISAGRIKNSSAHVWNYDPKMNLYLDLTHNLLDEKTPSVAALQVPNSVLHESIVGTKLVNELYEQFHLQVTMLFIHYQNSRTNSSQSTLS